MRGRCTCSVTLAIKMHLGATPNRELVGCAAVAPVPNKKDSEITSVACGMWADVFHTCAGLVIRSTATYADAHSRLYLTGLSRHPLLKFYVIQAAGLRCKSNKTKKDG